MAKRKKEESARNDLVRREKPTKRASIMRGIIAPICALIAVGCLIFALLNITVWKPQRTVTARADVKNSRYIITDAGVLNLIASHVRVTINEKNPSRNSSDNENVSNSTQQTQPPQTPSRDDMCVAVARTQDALGWLQSQHYVRITGLDSWKTLHVKNVGDSAKSSSPNTVPQLGNTGESVPFKDSDLWEKVTCSTPQKPFITTYEITNPQEVLLIDLGHNDTNISVFLQWNRRHIPNFATPLFVLTGIFVLLTVLSASIFAMEPHKRRHKAVMQEEKEAKRALNVAHYGENGGSLDGNSLQKLAQRPMGDGVNDGDIEEEGENEITISQAFADSFKALRNVGKPVKADNEDSDLDIEHRDSYEENPFMLADEVEEGELPFGQESAHAESADGTVNAYKAHDASAQIAKGNAGEAHSQDSLNSKDYDKSDQSGESADRHRYVQRDEFLGSNSDMAQEEEVHEVSAQELDDFFARMKQELENESHDSKA